MIFATIAAVMFATMGDQAYGVTISALFGCGIGAILAGIVKFAVLPNIQTYAGFCLVIGLVLIPTGIFASRPPIFLGMTLFFTILLGAANQMTYDRPTILQYGDGHFGWFAGGSGRFSSASAALASHSYPSPVDPYLA